MSELLWKGLVDKHHVPFGYDPAILWAEGEIERLRAAKEKAETDLACEIIKRKGAEDDLVKAEAALCRVREARENLSRDDDLADAFDKFDAALSAAAPCPHKARLSLADKVIVADPVWSLSDVLEKLADGADHLLADHDCDAHGWEQLAEASAVARKYIAAITAYRGEK